MKYFYLFDNLKENVLHVTVHNIKLSKDNKFLRNIFRL